jgi:hypothetical protein
MSPEAIRSVMERGRALPEFFELSTEDKKQAEPRLSVWVEGLTTVEQAWTLVGAARNRRIVLRLGVDAVRALRAEPAEPPHPGLAVEWEPATLPDGRGGRVPDTRPGFEGHAGVARLGDRRGTKVQRKNFRAALARIASVRVLTEVEVERIAAVPPPA